MPASARSPAPLFDELRHLFPGRILRVEPLAKAAPEPAEPAPDEADEAAQQALFGTADEDALEDPD